MSSASYRHHISFRPEESDVVADISHSFGSLSRAIDVILAWRLRQGPPPDAPVSLGSLQRHVVLSRPYLRGQGGTLTQAQLATMVSDGLRRWGAAREVGSLSSPVARRGPAAPAPLMPLYKGTSATESAARTMGLLAFESGEDLAVVEGRWVTKVLREVPPPPPSSQSVVDIEPLVDRATYDLYNLRWAEYRQAGMNVDRVIAQRIDEALGKREGK